MHTRACCLQLFLHSSEQRNATNTRKAKQHQRWSCLVFPALVVLLCFYYEYVPTTSSSHACKVHNYFFFFYHNNISLTLSEKTHLEHQHGVHSGQSGDEKKSPKVVTSNKLISLFIFACLFVCALKMSWLLLMRTWSIGSRKIFRERREKRCL